MLLFNITCVPANVTLVDKVLPTTIIFCTEVFPEMEVLPVTAVVEVIVVLRELTIKLLPFRVVVVVELLPAIPSAVTEELDFSAIEALVHVNAPAPVVLAVTLSVELPTTVLDNVVVPPIQTLDETLAVPETCIVASGADVEKPTRLFVASTNIVLESKLTLPDIMWLVPVNETLPTNVVNPPIHVLPTTFAFPLT